MDKEAFLGRQGSWWLLEAETEVDSRILEMRVQVGTDFRWDRDWYAHEERLQDLYTYLEEHDRDLLTELDLATDRDKQVEWITKLARLTAPAEPHGETAEAEHAEGPERQAGPEEGPTSEAAWDDNWQMLYRVNAAGEYQYAPSDDHKTPRPGASWMSYADAAAARAGDGSPKAGAAAFDDLPEEVVEVLETAVQGAMESLAPDKLSALAGELGMDEEELKKIVDELPADFEDMLKEQAALLAR